MAKQGAVRLNGRFPPGAEVRLVKVDGAHVLRAEGGEEVGTETVGKDGVLEFTKGVEPGGRYFACGLIDGVPTEVRLRGREKDDDAVNQQAPVGTDRVRVADGSFLDSPPEQHQESGLPEGAVWRGQHQVPEGVVQRIDVPRGQAYPIPAGELEDAAHVESKSKTTKAKE